MADGTPRFIYVTLQHPSPYYDDSYGVNSENNGPYGDAIMQELLPAVETKFRVIREPWARMLSRRIDGRLDRRWRTRSSIRISTAASFASCPDCGGLPLSPDRQHLQGRQRVLHRARLDEGRSPESAAARRQHSVDDERRKLVRARRRRQVALGRTVGHLGGDVLAGRQTTATRSGSGTRRPASSTRPSPRRGRSTTCGTSLEDELATLGPKIAPQAQHLHGRHGLVLPEQRASRLLNDVPEEGGQPEAHRRDRVPAPAPHCWGPRGGELLRKIDAHVTKFAPAGTDVKRWHY